MDIAGWKKILGSYQYSLARLLCLLHGEVTTDTVSGCISRDKSLKDDLLDLCALDIGDRDFLRLLLPIICGLKRGEISACYMHEYNITKLEKIYRSLELVHSCKNTLKDIDCGKIKSSNMLEYRNNIDLKKANFFSEAYSEFINMDKLVYINPREVITFLKEQEKGLIPVTLAELLTDQGQNAFSAGLEEKQLQLDSLIPINIPPSLWAGKTLPVACSTLEDAGYEPCVIAVILGKLSNNKTECGRTLTQDELAQGIERDPKTYQNKFKNLLEDANRKYLFTFND